MEQLVHLRLKSIYKAFKQSSSGRDPSTSAGGPLAQSSRIEELVDDDDIPDLVNGDCGSDDPQSLLQAAAAAAKMGSAHARHDYEGGVSKDNVARYMQEKEKADAAAAALLDELEQEETVAKSKAAKSKKTKKKKKAKLQAKKEEDQPLDDAKPAAVELTPEASSEEDIDVAEIVGSGPVSKVLSEDMLEEKEAKADPLEQELCQLVADADIEGLDDLLSSIKGVPGRAALRKNAKKALKRLRIEEMGELPAPPEPPQEPLRDSRSGAAAATPTTRMDTNGTASDLLKVISHMHNKAPTQPPGANNNRNRGTVAPGRSECVMHMAPWIVGWVIGKGGQRIRDLMEESGARVWINQEGLSDQDARVVYVSGNRKNVDIAVQMVKELVLKAPTAPSQSRRNTPPADAAPNTKNAPTSGKPPLILDSTDAIPSGGVGSKPRDGHASLLQASVDANGKSKHVMTCDPRFVPLLIGRRGWTIKHIQDSSGARVDIDQTVTPRKITLSGPDDTVQIAMRMVSDVLSYPHSQLQGGVDDDHVVDISDGTNLHLVAKETAEASPSSPSPLHVPPPSSSRPRPHSPPPSSLIMTGDAKDSISASSSLSSTPEPSMSSSSKSNYLQVAPIPMLQPAYGPGQGPGPPTTNGIGPNSFNRMQPPSPMPSVPTFPGNLGPPPQASLFGHPQHSPGFLQGQAHAAPVGGPMMPQQHRGAPMVAPGNQMGRPPPQPFPSGQEMPPFHRGQPQGFGQMPGSHPSQMPMQHQPSGYHPSQPVEPGNRGGPAPGDMWGLSQPRVGPEPSMPPQRPDGFRLDAAVDFLQHSNHQQQANTMPLPTDGLMGLSQPVEPRPIGGNRQPDPSMLPRGDEFMVDSLFGPAKSSRNDPSLVTGLQGLSIRNEQGLGGGLWGGSNSGSSSGLQGLSLPPDGQGTKLKEPSTLFATAPPTTVAANEHHPSQSRFAWGGSPEGHR